MKQKFQKQKIYCLPPIATEIEKYPAYNSNENNNDTARSRKINLVSSTRHVKNA